MKTFREEDVTVSVNAGYMVGNGLPHSLCQGPISFGAGSTPVDVIGDRMGPFMEGFTPLLLGFLFKFFVNTYGHKMQHEVNYSITYRGYVYELI